MAIIPLKTISTKTCLTCNVNKPLDSFRITRRTPLRFTNHCQCCLSIKLNQWELDLRHPSNTGTYIMARNLSSKDPLAREWHMTAAGSLRKQGVTTPIRHSNSWEVDWNKRRGKKVWARNIGSMMKKARGWHFVDHNTITNAGITWIPDRVIRNRHLRDGYVILAKRGLTADDIKIADQYNLWHGRLNTFLVEHILVATKKYGAIPKGYVVRHLDGNKENNHPDNLCLGTPKENTMDHVTARLQAMMWREKYENALLEIQNLRNVIESQL